MPTQPNQVRELSGSWAFETSDDGTIFYYPHGWGRAYVVPTEATRREIEEQLGLWLARARSVQSTMRRMLPVFLAAFVIGYLCVILRLSYTVGSVALISGALMGVLGGLIMCGLIATLRFLAEAAKADLEKANQRRPYREWLRDRAKQSDWSQLWYSEAFSIFIILIGVWALWPRTETVMRPARVHAGHPSLYVWMTVAGAYYSLLGLWQIRVKLKSERRAA